MADGETRVKFEASLGETGEGEPARLYVWVRLFQGEEELTGRYEVFEDLARFDGFIARASEAGQDVAELQRAREIFAAGLGKTD
jgi:hypothetical protein